VSATLDPPRRPAPEAADAGARLGGSASTPTEGHGQLGARLALFGALGLLAAAQWSSLVGAKRVWSIDAGPLDLRIGDQGGRALLVVVAVLAGGWLLARSRALRLPRGAASAARLLVAIGTLALALIAAGVPVELLGPTRWSELADGVDRGLAGIRTVRWPYAGGDEWIRLAVLSAAPLALAPAAVLAFWPASRRRARELFWLASVAAPLVLYGVAVVELDPGADLRRGALLFVLLAVWLWLPRLERTAVGPGLVALACVAVLAAGVAAVTDRDVPLIQYQTWSSNAAATRFEWDHSYGPLDWSRTGATLLQVRSRRPHYWKAQTLDRFDGRRWLRSAALPALAPTDLPDDPNPAWIEEFEVTVRGLSSELVVGAGTTYNVTGAGATSVAPDGTAVTLDDPLEEGDSYSVNTYVPDPTAGRMRAAAGPYLEGLSSYTEIALPPEAPVRAGDVAGGEVVSAGFRGEPLTASPTARERLRASPYGRTYALARRLAPARLSTYDAVKAIERHLQQEYEYSERPPRRALPLDAFLFEDRRGYCQQFSGAMALMLRMNGIPARVATGFTPGSFDRSTGEYRVRDLDAHSWVEAFFPGIGWVPFDPTPSVSPAEAQVGALGSASAARGGSADAGGSGRESGADGGTSERAADTPGGPVPEDDVEAAPGPTRSGGLLAAVAIGLGAVALASIAAVAARARGRSAPELDALAADPELRELGRALASLGHPAPGGVTLSALERRFSAEGRTGAAAYVRALAERRFAPRGGPRPGRAARRALRRDLSLGGGPGRRLRAFVALPPWGSAAFGRLSRT